MAPLAALVFTGLLAARARADMHDHGGDVHEFAAVIGRVVDVANPAELCLMAGDACAGFCTLAYDVELNGTALTLVPAGNEDELVDEGAVTCDCAAVAGTGTVDEQAMNASGTLGSDDAFGIAWNSGETLLVLTVDSCTLSYTLLDGEFLGKNASALGRPAYEGDEDEDEHGDEGDHDHDEHDERAVLALEHAEPASCESDACVVACQSNYSALLAHDLGVLRPNPTGTPPAGCACFRALAVYNPSTMALAGYDENGTLFTFQVVEEADHEEELQLTEEPDGSGCDLHYEVVQGELLGVGEHDHEHDHEFTAVIGIAVDKDDEPTNCAPLAGDEAACGLFCLLAFSVDVDGREVTLTPEATVEGEEMPLDNACDCHELGAHGDLNAANTSVDGTLDDDASTAFTLEFNQAETLLTFTIGTGAEACANEYTLLDGELFGKSSSDFGRPIFEEGQGTHEHNTSLLTLLHADPSSCETAPCAAECFSQWYALAAHDLALLQPLDVAIASSCVCHAVLVVYDSMTEMAGYDENATLFVFDTVDEHDDELLLQEGACEYHYNVSGGEILGVGPGHDSHSPDSPDTTDAMGTTAAPADSGSPRAAAAAAVAAVYVGAALLAAAV